MRLTAYMRHASVRLAILLVVLQSSALAEETRPRWVWTEFQWENDDMFPQPDEEPGDRYYTNGLRATWTKVDGDPPQWSRTVRSLFCGEAADDCGVIPRIAIGQNFFTPEDISIRSPQPEDRPWAGWLYGSLGATVGDATYQHDLELQLGLTGYGSLSPWVQTQWHRLLNIGTPKGWNNTYESEVGVNAFYRYQRIVFPRRFGSVEFDFVPRAGLALGTIANYAAVGATARVGRNISGFPSSTIHPTAPAAVSPLSSNLLDKRPHDSARPRPLEIYAFVGAEGRGVLYNYFLEGSLFRDDIGVDPEDFVWDFQYGIVGEYRGWRIGYTINRRSAEFKPIPDSGIGIHNFVSVSISRSLQ